jgi:hypothetical protein
LQAFQQTHWCRFLRKNFPIRNPSVLWAGKFLMWIQNRHLIISYWMYTFGAPLVASCTAIECFFLSGEPRSRADKLRATWMNCKDRQDCDPSLAKPSNDGALIVLEFMVALHTSSSQQDKFLLEAPKQPITVLRGCRCFRCRDTVKQCSICSC